jgi:TetR/AcrR family transcriptional repressor of bet genes
VAGTKQARRPPADKHDERRNQLAESALRTLGELGYARTSLREIANNSEFSHGVVHYYFADKLELITFCIRYHKAQCVTRYDQVVATSTSPEQLLDGFAAKLVDTITHEAPLHRLWYDLRIQGMFEPRLRETVMTIDQWLQEMVWRIVTRFAELSGRPPAMDPASAYAVFDGLFQQALLAHSVGQTGALPALVAQVHSLLPLTLMAPTAEPAGA